MNGDRLKILEQGFLDGKLTPEEETELKQLVRESDDHHLKAYFQWTAESQHIEVPDFSTRLNLEKVSKPFWQVHLRKIAATLLILITAVFILQDQLFDKQEQQPSYTQAEIDQSYEATIATLTAMATFLDKSLSTTEAGIDFSAPFKEFNALKNSKNNNP